MLDDAIKKFFDERKLGWLNKKIKASMSEEEKSLYEEEAEEKFSMDNWLPDAARRAGQLFIASHPCTFSYPSSKIGSIIANSTKKADGFLRTGNCEARLDVYGNAAALDVYKFLSLKLFDGKTLLVHMEQESETVRQQLAINTASFDEIKKGLLSIQQGYDTVITNGKVKQVYFPYNEDYHLLSILTPSGLMFELKNRVNEMRFSEQTKDGRQLKKDNNYSESGFDDLFNLTLIGYGGTKPQNISVLNSQYGGKAYLLPSLPPVLQKRNVRLPKYNFFSNTLWIGRFKDNFSNLHKLLQQEYNNSKIRKRRDSIFRYIIDNVIDVMWSVRNHETGWSHTEYYSSLPIHQKMWLDNIWLKERENSDDWLNKVIEEFARWIVLTYKKLHGKQGFFLGDDELLHVKTLVEQSREALV